MVTALYTYIYALYILHKCTCTYMLDVSKRGVLGSADDDIAFFLHIVTFFIDHGQIHYFSLCFRYFDDVLHYFSLFFSNYMVQLKVIMSLWWKDMDFKKKRVPREKSGRHSNLVYLVPKPLLKNPGRHSVIFQYFEDVFHYCSMFFILKMVFIDVSLF